MVRFTYPSHFLTGCGTDGETGLEGPEVMGKQSSFHQITAKYHRRRFWRSGDVLDFRCPRIFG